MIYFEVYFLWKIKKNNCLKFKFEAFRCRSAFFSFFQHFSAPVELNRSRKILQFCASAAAIFPRRFVLWFVFEALQETSCYQLWEVRLKIQLLSVQIQATTRTVGWCRWSICWYVALVLRDIGRWTRMKVEDRQKSDLISQRVFFQQYQMFLSSSYVGSEDFCFYFLKMFPCDHYSNSKICPVIDDDAWWFKKFFYLQGFLKNNSLCSFSASWPMFSCFWAFTSMSFQFRRSTWFWFTRSLEISRHLHKFFSVRFLFHSTHVVHHRFKIRAVTAA